MKRAILLQTDATESKKGKLRSALSTAASEFNRLRDERDHCAKFMDFHRKVYSSCKKRTSFNSQVVCDIERSVWRSKGKIRGITLKFNVPRNYKVFDKSVPFVKFSRFSKDPVPIPIVRNRNFQRYSDLLRSGWTCKTYGQPSRLGVVAYLSKDEAILTPKRNMLGIDFNAKRIAITILSGTNRALYQAYFGLHICGAVGKGYDSRNYALFRCRDCGVVVNSDRNASRNVALKCLLERNDALNRVLFQVSNRGGLVNGLGKMSDEVGLPNVAVQHAYQLMESHAL